VSFDPNPGNPTTMAISETKKIGHSGGKIAYTVVLSACTRFSGGYWCTDVGGYIGVYTK
jgi:hypothetical protein